MIKYNKDVEIFIQDNNINLKEFHKNKDAMIYNKDDINNIVSRYGIYKPAIKENICIADIIGKESGKSQNILDEINEIFCSDLEEYYRRSISMLKYSNKDIIKNLEESFRIQPITIREIKNKKYCIKDNGMHRYTILRTHYLNELNRCKQNSIEDLNNKYTIPVLVERLDTIKTYSKYILQNLNRFIEVNEYLDNNYKRTNKVILIDENGEKSIYNDEQLLHEVKKYINKIGINNSLINNKKRNKDFQEFLLKYDLNIL